MMSLVVAMVCASCGRSGRRSTSARRRPSWCRCARSSYGPIVAAPGTVVMFRFESAEAAAFRARCRLAGNAERAARDALSELPEFSTKRRRLKVAYATALAGLEALQATCAHPEPSFYARERCGCCYAALEPAS